MTAALADSPFPSTPVLTLVDPGADPAELSVEELGSRIVGLAGRLAAAMSAGRVSYSHVRAIARVARAGEEQVVADLLKVAESGTVGQLETIVRGLRTVEDLADGAAVPEEFLRTGWAPNGLWQLGARLDPERGAVVGRAIEAMWAAVVVHLDLAAARSIAGEEREDREETTARIADGPGVPDAVVERLLCHGRLRTSLHRAVGSMFDLGRTRRVMSARLFRALLDRDGCCSPPGCHSCAGLEAHHVRHWLHGGRTDLANLVLLCRRHHAHHRDEFAIAISPDGCFVFRRPDGRVLEQHVDPGRLSRVSRRGWRPTGRAE